MVATAVTFDGTRLNSSDSNTGWGNFQPSSGGAPSSEAANAYQITTGATANTGVVGRQSQSTTGRRGIDYNGTSVNYTAAANRMWYVKCYVTDAFDLNTTWGVEVAMGSSDANNDHRYNLAGSGANLTVYSAYPSQGGYLITCIDPTIDTWREAENGTLDQTAVIWYAMGAQMINGNSKSENVALDAIDYGTGLTLLSGTGADPAGLYTDFVAEDQDLVTNRWGAAVGSGNNATLRGIMTVGAAGTATEFDDSASVVTFPDGYHSRGLFGVLMDIGNASSILVDGALLIGEGTRNALDANDTRPDYEVQGTAGAYTFNGTIRNFRDVTFTSVCDVDGASIECHLLTQASANIFGGTIIKCNALASVACLQDPTFGSTTDLRDTTFIQTGAGHAIELDTATSYDFNDLFFEGFNATNNQDDSMIDVTIGSGTVTINVDGGTAAISYRTAGATVVVNASVPVNVDGVTEGTSVKLIARETLGAVTDGDTLAEGFADSTGNFTYSHNDEGTLSISVVARNQGIVVAGIAEDGGVFTDETAETSSNTTADMTLLPAVPATSDAYYFAHNEQFTRMKLDVSTALAQSSAPTLVWEYWNGAWVSLSGVSDGTNALETLGVSLITWSLPGDWATTTVNSQGPLYYVRVRLSVVGTITTVPVGRRATLDTTRYLPYDASREIVTGTGLSDIASWNEDTISKFIDTD